VTEDRVFEETVLVVSAVAMGVIAFEFYLLLASR
jgi:hypothetical protein